MTNSVALSALTIVALTGITLMNLKYRHDNEHSAVTDDEDYNIESMTPIHYNPKFLYFDGHDEKNQSTETSVVKRSISDHDEYSIDVEEASAVDMFRREKVKEVESFLVQQRHEIIFYASKTLINYVSFHSP